MGKRPNLRPAPQDPTWSIVSGNKGLENDVVLLAALTDIETDWHREIAYVGMSRARMRLDVFRGYPTRCASSGCGNSNPRTDRSSSSWGQ